MLPQIKDIDLIVKHYLSLDKFKKDLADFVLKVMLLINKDPFFKKKETDDAKFKEELLSLLTEINNNIKLLVPKKSKEQTE